MNNRIDVSCDLYSNLVTRPTGAAVRLVIEHQLDEIGDHALAILDFSHVRLLDFSCADEIVAKLLLQYVSQDIPKREVYFVFYGMSESHIYAIDAVLERHGLALVTQLADGNPCLMGTVDGEERQIWEAMSELGSAGPADVATASGLDRARVEDGLDHLWRRRLVIRQDDGYVSLRGGQGTFSTHGIPPAETQRPKTT
ncbi:MAG: hypothetical protein ABI875_00085 [Gemmatimonadales bacterium]